MFSLGRFLWYVAVLLLAAVTAMGAGYLVAYHFLGRDAAAPATTRTEVSWDVTPYTSDAITVTTAAPR